MPAAPGQSRIVIALVLAVSAAFAVVACSSGGGGSAGGAASGGASSGASAAPRTGVLSVLSYNVAGLPAGLSSSQPQVYTQQISPLLNAYDLVLAQEDFWYHTQLAAQARHPYRTPPQSGHTAFMNDGLNAFSVPPMGAPDRQTWVSCNGVRDQGSDCLAAKGFALTTIVLAPGLELDVVNHHADAGGGARDEQARADQFRQLGDYLAARPADRALIVAGDTNLKSTRVADEAVLTGFMGRAGLADACRTLACGDDRIDRVMLRDGRHLTLRPILWRIAPEFVDAQGNDLSDHEAVHVLVEWTER